jgi:hypothetical protein
MLTGLASRASSAPNRDFNAYYRACRSLGARNVFNKKSRVQFLSSVITMAMKNAIVSQRFF